MGVYAVWPFFACMFLLLVLAASPVLKLADAHDPTPNRVSTLDGLRGLSALCVFFYHATIYHKYLASGAWTVPPSYFYLQLGPLGVKMFFMITGYLFWRIMIKSAGRPRWLEFYIHRVFRIAPLYFFAMVAAIVTIFADTGFALRVPMADLIQSFLTISTLGILQMPSVNGYGNTVLVLAGVTWSLKYEWYFYASLLLTGQAARSKIAALVLPAAALAAFLYLLDSPALQLRFSLNAGWLIFGSQFCFGMICAAVQACGLRLFLPTWMASGLVVAAIGSMILFVDHLSFDESFALQSLAFYLIASGCRVFGLLSTTAARRLGNASFGIYLLQGLILAWVFALTPVKAFALDSSYHYWMILLLCAVCLSSLAAATHYVLEQPGIRLGKLLGRATDGWLGKARRLLIA